MMSKYQDLIEGNYKAKDFFVLPMIPGIKRAEVEEIREGEITFEQYKTILTEFSEFCVEWNGLGLAASQLGINKAFAICAEIVDKKSINKQTKKEEIKKTRQFYFVANPVYYKADGSRTQMAEGCFSYKDKTFHLKRWKNIRAKYNTFDEKGNWTTVTRKLYGDSAICFQHECDHCHGITIADKGKEIA